MKQLSALDSAFLFLETRKTPMHIGALYIFSAPDKKSASFQEFRQRVQQRLHLAPVLRQKIIPVPFGLDAPYLVDDPDFCLNMHLSHIGLPQPCTRVALNQLAAEIHHRPLDRESALWELVFIDNMSSIDIPGRYSFAVISKIHHAIVDDMGGEEILSKLLDFSPEPNHRVSYQPYKPAPMPSSFDLFIKSYGSALRNPIKMAHIVAKASSAGAHLIARKAAGGLKKITSLQRAPASLFERQLSDDRVFAHTTLSLTQLKRCRTLCPNATIHDVVMGIIGSGLTSYLADRDALPKDNLIALVPISSPAMKRKTKNLGPQELSAMLVTIATQNISTVERIHAVQASNPPPKNQRKATKISQLTAFLPSLYLSIATKLYTRWNISNSHNPLFNIVVSNVPGPQIPMFMGKAKLVEQYGNAPVFHGMGLSIVIMSYDGNLSISVNSCSSILPDPECLAQYIQTSFVTLWEESKPKAVVKPQKSRRKKGRSLTDQITNNEENKRELAQTVKGPVAKRKNQDSE